LDLLINFCFFLFFSSLAAYFDLGLRAREAAKKENKNQVSQIIKRFHPIHVFAL